MTGGDGLAYHVDHGLDALAWADIVFVPGYRFPDREDPPPAVVEALVTAHGRGTRLAAISTGAYGYPLDEAAPVSIEAVKRAITGVELVRFVLFERNGWLGGKAAVLEGAGFRFDMGPTILTVPSVLRRIFDN